MIMVCFHFQLGSNFHYGMFSFFLADVTKDTRAESEEQCQSQPNIIPNKQSQALLLPCSDNTDQTVPGIYYYSYNNVSLVSIIFQSIA